MNLTANSIQSSTFSSPSSEVILAIETATSICSVALYEGDSLYQLREQGTGVHSTRLGGMIHELLSQSGTGIESIQTVLLSAGPGSFTGLRIGTSFVKGLFFDRNVQFIRVSTLPVMAYSLVQFHSNSKFEEDSSPEAHQVQPLMVHVVLDARRQHLYHWSGEFQGSSRQITDVREIHGSNARELGQIEQLLKAKDLLGGLGSERLGEEKRSLVHLYRGEIIGARASIEAYLNPAMSSFFEKADLASFAPDYLS